MKSCDLSGFSCWRRWDDEAVGDAPGLPGVYAFRLVGNGFGRLKGESDLVYISSAESISRRLSDHLPARAEALDCAGRLRDAGRVGELEVAWKAVGSSEEAGDEEARLLRRYYWDHVELPPVNRDEPTSHIRMAIEHVGELYPLELAEKAVQDIIRQKRAQRAAGLRE